jgi:hypothetical protein
MAAVMMRFRQGAPRGPISTSPFGGGLYRSFVVQAHEGPRVDEGAQSHWMVVPAGVSDWQNGSSTTSCCKHQAQQQPDDPQSLPHGVASTPKANTALTDQRRQ